MMLQTLLDTALAEARVPRSRIGPLKTAIKQYAAMFQLEPQHIPPETYHLSKAALWEFVDKHLPPHLGPRAIANLKDNVRWLLALGVQEKWLLPLVGPVIPWHTQRHFTGHLRRVHIDGVQINRQPYWLMLPPDPTKQHSPKRQAAIDRHRRGLQIMPDALRREVEAYIAWCTTPYAPNRPAVIKKRLISGKDAMHAIQAIGGYAVHIAGMPLDELSLLTLTEPTLVQNHIAWWVNERRQRITSTIVSRLVQLFTITKYWLKHSAQAEALQGIMQSIGRVIPAVWNKEASLISLRELERIGLSCYPLNDERLLRSSFARAVAQHIRNPEQYALPYRTSLFKTATAAQMSLLIRLMVRIPLRQRNLREMRIGHHLKRVSEKQWEIHFRGEELKIASRQGQINEVRFAFPQDLQWLLDEWLAIWRPALLRGAQDPGHLFLTRYGESLNRDAFTVRFKETVYRFSGVYLTPHLVRDIWASEYLDATGDITGAADRLGDTPQTVMQRYAHVLKRKAQYRTENWLSAQISEGISR
jgi:Phage integrase family